MTFTAQEEKLFDEMIDFGNRLTEIDDEKIMKANEEKHLYCSEAYPESIWELSEDKIKSFLRDHDQRLIDYILEQWPKEMGQYETVLVGVDGDRYQWQMDNKSFNSALQQTRKLLEDYKKEL